MSHEARLKELGLVLPPLPQPKGTYLPGVLHNDLLYLSGQGPVLEDGTLATGTVGTNVTVEQAHFHAFRTGLVLLAAARQNSRYTGQGGAGNQYPRHGQWRARICGAPESH